MRVRQIGSIIFDNNTNIVVDATALDTVGGGFRVNELDGPQPFAVEVAFIRSTRQLALNALNTLARDLYIEAQRRESLRLSAAGGAVVVVEDEAGTASLRSRLVNASVSLITVENTSTGVIARARVAGTLLGPFATSASFSQTFSTFRAYELRTVTLTNISDTALAIHNIDVTINNSTNLRNALFVFETRESATATSRIYRKSPSSVSGNLVLGNFNAGDTTLQRARFTSSGTGTVTYNLANSEVPIDVFNLFFEVYLVSTPSSDVLYSISWDGQPEITGVVDYNQTFINAGIYARAYSATTVTIQITNAPINSYVSPLIFVPINGTFVYNATAPNLSTISANNPITEALLPLRAFSATEGELRGPAGFIAGRYLAIFSGMMIPAIPDLTASVTIRSRRIEPASFA